MSSFDALGPIYAKMGIATSPEIIAARKAAADAGFQAFKQAHLGSAISGALGLGPDGEAEHLFDVMREKDPTLDLEPSDLEATALLSAILSAEMNVGDPLGGLVALGLVTAAFGAVRQSPTHPQLVEEAENALAQRQFVVSSGSGAIAAPKMPHDVTEALGAISVQNMNFGPVLAPNPAMAAIRKVAEYTHLVHGSALSAVNGANAHIRRLEEELRTYWWVVGGWSDELKVAFRTTGQSEAAVLAGYELAAKTTLPLGLFAAPALLDRVIREDRKGSPQMPPLSEAIGEVPKWFRQRFQTAATVHAELLPVTLALALSGEGGEDEDWRPRFKRLAKLPADCKMSPHDLALQTYRETLFGRALSKPG